MKTKKIVAIVLLSILAAALICVMLFTGGFISSVAFAQAQEITETQKNLDVVTGYEGEHRELNAVHIDFTNEDVTFYESKNNTFLVEARRENGESYEFYCGVYDGELYIESMTKDTSISNITPKDKVFVNIYIPKSYSNNIYIGNISGNINGELSGWLSQVLVDTVSSECSLDINSAEDIDVNCISGSYDIKIGNVNNVNFSNTSGDYNLNFENVPNTITVSTVSGEGNIYLPKDATVKCNEDTVSGEITNEFGNSQNGKCEIAISDTSGRLDIKKK